MLCSGTKHSQSGISDGVPSCSSYASSLIRVNQHGGAIAGPEDVDVWHDDGEEGLRIQLRLGFASSFGRGFIVRRLP